MTRAVTSRKSAMLVSTLAVASTVAPVTSFMEETNSATRSTSVFSSALILACEPDSTSCNMMLASRSRSNSAVVSARSILCVSSISLTVEVAVDFDSSIAFCAVVCRSVSVRLTVLEAASPALLIMRVISALLSSIVRVKANPLSLDRLHRLVGRLGDVGGELLALFGDGGEHAAALVGQQDRHFVGALADRGGDLVGLAGDVAGDLGADAGERALDLAGAAAQRLAGGDGELAERALGFRRVALDRLAELLEARMQRVGGRLGAGFELVGHGLGAADQEFLEAVDAGVERIGDLERARAQGLVDLADLGADRVGDLVAARGDGTGHRADAGIERIEHLFAALREAGGEVGDARCEGLLELREPCIDRTGKHAGVAVDALIEGVDVIAHRLGDVFGALTQPLHQFAAIGLHRTIELGHVAGDQAAERRAVARNLFAERGAALVEHVLEGLQARAQHGLDLVAAAGEDQRQAFGVGAEGIGDRVAALDHGVGDARAGLLQLGDDVAAAQAQIEHQRIAGRTQRGVYLLGAGGDGFGHLAAGLRERVVELLRAAGHGFDGDGGLLREALRDLVEPGGHHLLQPAAEVGEFVVDIVGLEIEAGGQPVAGGADGGGGAVAGGLQPVEHGRAALGQRIDHAVADVT